MHAVAPKIGSGKKKTAGQLMLDGQAPGLRVQVPPILSLQRARVIREACEAGEIRSALLKSGSERWRVDARAEGVAFKPGVQVIILSGTVIDAEACPNNGLAMQRRGGPGDAHSRIKILVVGIVEHGIFRTRRSVDRDGKRRVERS